MDAFRQLAAADVDAFTAPSRQLLERFVAAGAVPRDRVHYLAYGFDRARLAGRRRRRRTQPAAPGDEPFVFAYIGRHEPSKGIHLLVAAAYELAVDEAAAAAPTLPPFRVAIYGRDNGANSAGLRRLVDAGNARLAAARAAAGHDGGDAAAGSGLVTFESEYRNPNIVAAVFDRVDAIVVPSIWDENAPLVIHEALQARVPVVTADAGGMAELIADGVNGTLFAHRDAGSLAAALRRVLRDPAGAAAMAERGYLGDPTGGGNVPGVDEQVAALAALYTRAASSRAGATAS
jgi:glycosyltransferase involved in cell wall biosynthesis